MQRKKSNNWSNFFLEFQADYYQISTITLELYANSLKQLAIFIIAEPMKKHIQQFIYQRVFPVNLLTEKFYGFIAIKQSIFYAGYSSQVSILFPYIR